MYKYLLILLLFPIGLSGQGQEDTITFSIDLAEYVVTAQHEPTHYKKAIHNISIIDREKIQKIGAVTLDQTLLLVPSVRIYQDPVLGTSIRMRGMASENVAIMVDGVPMIGRNNGAIDLSQIAMQNVERIEVIEGPLSSIYGNNAAGGLINIITRKSQVKKWVVSQENQIESIGQKNHTLSLGYQYDKFNFGVNGRYFDYNQYPIDSLRLVSQIPLEDGTNLTLSKFPFNPKQQKSIGAYLRTNFDEDNSLTLKYDFNVEDVNDYGTIKRPQFKPYAQDQLYNTNRNDITAIYQGKLKNDTYLNITASSNDYSRLRVENRYYLETMTIDSLLTVKDSIEFNQLFGKANLSYTGWKDWVMMGGYNFTREKGKGDRLKEGLLGDSLIAVFTEHALFADIKYQGIKNTQLSLSSRYLNHSKYQQAFTSSFQFKYDFSTNLTLRSSIGQGYRSPSLKELYLDFVDFNHNIIGNASLLPERSTDIQATLSYQYKDRLSIKANVFHTMVKDKINLVEYETLKFRYDNIDSYSTYGIQPSLQFKLGAMDISSGVSIGFWSTDLGIESAPQYGRVVDINNAMSYVIPRVKSTFTLNHRYAGKQPIYRYENDEVVLNSIEGYHLIDGSISRFFWQKRIKAVIGIRNLLDVQFTQVNGSTGGQHATVGRNSVSTGRSMFLNLGFTF